MVKSLRVKESSSYQCLVYSYQAGHGHLRIKVEKFDEYDTSKNFELDFSDVMYFSGPFVWKGLELEEGNIEECVNVVSSSLLIDPVDKKFLEQYRLYKLKALDGTVIKIVSQNVMKKDSTSNIVNE